MVSEGSTTCFSSVCTSNKLASESVLAAWPNGSGTSTFDNSARMFASFIVRGRMPQ